MSLAVELRGIVKRFGAFTALDHVDLNVAEGSIHAVVGENGAGKTTLMRILYGALSPEEGDVAVQGQARRFAGPKDALALGIGMVSQHYSIIPELTCLQNLLLGAEPGAVMPLAQAEKRAQVLADRMGFAFDWRRPAEGLGPSDCQKLEILKLLWRDCRILILDEPTAMLSPSDGVELFKVLRNLVKEGATVILVTHRLPEVMVFADHVTVLRQGREVASRPVASITDRELAELIVGHSVEATQFDAPIIDPSMTPRLEVRDLDILGDRGDLAVSRASLRLLPGELVGIAGVDGSGQRELFQTLVGTRRARSGDLRLDGAALGTMSIRARIRAGMRVIPEDRHAQGVVESWSLVDNACLGLQRLAPVNVQGRLSRTGMQHVADQALARFGTRFADARMAIGGLSGGNQQRLVAGRALAIEPRLLLAFQPARGLDIDATSAVYAGLRDACRDGAAGLVIGFDLDELLNECDRVVVMFEGLLIEPSGEAARDRDHIGRLMVGAT
ncbi:MAG: ABC transporter ATP-binding protein [Fimbriimonadaceae bacterium]